MSLPSIHAADNAELRRRLYQRASLYTVDEEVCRRIVDRTIFAIVEDLDLLNGEDIWHEVFNVLHGFARAEIGVSDHPPPATATPMIADARSDESMIASEMCDHLARRHSFGVVANSAKSRSA
ncbi:hypothetical protein EDF70_11564 [Neorhizobium sp. JUb45]|nr:hypothetical protein EDF70_11564 [Neorhizobium sp. JUb45]